MKASDKRFQIGVQSDPVEFMSWLLNTLHAKLKNSKKKNRSIIHDCFQVSFPGQVDINSVIDIISATYQVTLELFLQGELEVVKEVHRKHIMEKREDGDELNGEAGSVVGTADGIVTETSKVPFLMLGLDLPPPPLFKDAMEKNIIPQVCLPQAHLCSFLVMISC
jgi:U4/U6.U5 tri-snRNP-associated protein 2